MLTLALLIASVVCLGLAAFGVGSRHLHLGWLGVGLYVLAQMLEHV